MDEAEAIREAQTKAEELLDAAEQHQWSGNDAEAVQACAAALQLGALSVQHLLRAVLVLRETGEEEAAEQIAGGVLAQLTAAREADPANADIAAELGFALSKLDQDDAALPHLEAALGRTQDPMRPVYLMADIHLKRGAPDLALDAFQRLSTHHPEDGDIMLRGAAMLAHFGAHQQARALLRWAEPHLTGRRQEFNHIAALCGASDAVPDQAAVAEELFDGFAESYDRVLKQIGNNGPVMVGRMLAMLGLEQQGALRVLDAGCGTGLCVPYLRPYAAEIHGIDLSARMLTQAKEKGLYERLTRSDISRLDTMPDGPFDIIVAADVLTYFGALDAPLENFAALLGRDGWLIFTVELSADSEPFQLASTGRYKHSAAYVYDQIASAGLQPFARRINAPLRFEYSHPVDALCIAARKPA